MAKAAIMPTRKVTLTPELAEFVSEAVASGDYASASELVRNALRLLKRERDMEKEKFEKLRRAFGLEPEHAEPEACCERPATEIAAEVIRHWR